MICTAAAAVYCSSCDGATHVLSTLLRTVCTTYRIYGSSCSSRGLTFLRSYAVGHLITRRVFISKQKNSSSIKVAGNYPAFCGTHISTLTLSPPAPSRITILHLLAATSDGPPKAFPGQEYQVDKRSSIRRRIKLSACSRTK